MLSQHLTKPSADEVAASVRLSPQTILLDAIVAATRAGAPERVITALWSHASEVARLARDIAPLAGVDPFDAAAAGFLHDLGELLMLADRPDDYPAVLATAEDHAGQLAAEKLAFGTDHALLAAQHLLDHRVAHVVADAVADHHDPFRDSEPTTIVVAAADEIADGDPDRIHAMDLLGIDASTGALMLAAVRALAPREAAFAP